MTLLVMSMGGNVLDAAFARVTLAPGATAGIGDNLHKLSASDVVAAAGEVWEKVRTVLDQAA